MSPFMLLPAFAAGTLFGLWLARERIAGLRDACTEWRKATRDWKAAYMSLKSSHPREISR